MDENKELGEKMLEFKLSNVEIMNDMKLGTAKIEDYKNLFAKAQALNKENIKWLDLKDSNALVYTTTFLLGYEDFGLAYIEKLYQNHKDLLTLMLISMMNYIDNTSNESDHDEPEILEK